MFWRWKGKTLVRTVNINIGYNPYLTCFFNYYTLFTNKSSEFYIFRWLSIIISIIKVVTFFWKENIKKTFHSYIFNVNTVTSVGYQMLPVFVYNLFCSIYLTPSLRKWIQTLYKHTCIVYIHGSNAFVGILHPTKTPLYLVLFKYNCNCLVLKQQRKCLVAIGF